MGERTVTRTPAKYQEMLTSALRGVHPSTDPRLVHQHAVWWTRRVLDAEWTRVVYMLFVLKYGGVINDPN